MTVSFQFGISLFFPHTTHLFELLNKAALFSFSPPKPLKFVFFHCCSLRLLDLLSIESAPVGNPSSSFIPHREEEPGASEVDTQRKWQLGAILYSGSGDWRTPKTPLQLRRWYVAVKLSLEEEEMNNFRYPGETPGGQVKTLTSSCYSQSVPHICWGGPNGRRE